MPESRKNHFNIDGGQEKDGDNEQTGTFRPIPQGDGDFRTSRSSIGKSKEKVSDGAEEKLLQDSDDVKIGIRVSMTDAKYVVGDHRNGDAKIELDANKRQFSGLTKEELLKYKDDPFWVRLRWTLFILFWLLWLCMLAGAIIIIVRAPKCYAPTPKTWDELGPLVDMCDVDYPEIENKLPTLKSSSVAGVFVSVEDTYKVLDDPSAVESFKKLVAKAKELSIKLIVDLTPNFVSTSHRWFTLSANRSAEFDSYFVWADARGFDKSEKRIPPSNWVSRLNTPSWQFHEGRGQFFLQQHGDNTADLNFTNSAVVGKFDDVLKAWMQAGAAGVRLRHARSLLVTRLADGSFPDEPPSTEPVGSGHTEYSYYNHKYTVDHEQLDELLPHWSKVVEGSAEKGVTTVFTLYEDGSHPPLHHLSRSPALMAALHPRSATVTLNAENVDTLNDRLKYWPALKLQSPDADSELALFTLLLPASPVLNPSQVIAEQNDTKEYERMSHLVSIRTDPSVAHGHWTVLASKDINSTESLIAIKRWKPSHTGYLAVYNPSAQDAHAQLQHVAAALSVHHVSMRTRALANYTTNMVVQADNVLVPAKSTVVLSYVPKGSTEE